MSLGVRGILRKTLPVETLLRCLNRVIEGELWFEKALTDSIMSARRYSLTRREGQLVSLLSQGLKNKEIAIALTISEGTVKVYLSRLFQKLGVKDRFELALYGLKNLNPGGGSLDNVLPGATGVRPVRNGRRRVHFLSNGFPRGPIRNAGRWRSSNTSTLVAGNIRKPSRWTGRLCRVARGRGGHAAGGRQFARA